VAECRALLRLRWRLATLPSRRSGVRNGARALEELSWIQVPAVSN
jgi:hypothetical protein